jgi:solute carrier family 34 (sodium-dependent phosphate cotransporter)
MYIYMVKFSNSFKKEIIREWENDYINLIALKEKTNRDYLANSENPNAEIVIFDGMLEEEIEKINIFYRKHVKIINEWIDAYKNNNQENNFIIIGGAIINIDESFKNTFEKCDKLRQYILLNIIAIIKIVKRRNKRTPNIKDIKQLLEENDFYKCNELKQAYTDLTDIRKRAKGNYADKLMQNMSMIVSFKSLANIRNNCNFEEYNYLPNYNTKKIDDATIRNYLDMKLGPNNNLEELVGVDEGITEKHFQKENNKITTKWKITYFFIIITLLYFFIFGLNLMSSSFKVLSGKGMSILSTISNPIAGVMIGIISTVLLQSSSTSTSIIVTMVGANILTVTSSIPIIMGANIGTSVTNTLVAHAHIKNIDEFKRAFAGATVHDMFNFLSVIVLLPIEVISQAAGYSLLYNFSNELTNVFFGSGGSEFESPIKVIVSPFTDLFLVADKDVIKASAMGCIECDSGVNSTITKTCWDVTRNNCLTYEEWKTKYEDAQVIKSGFLKGAGDSGGGALGLLFSLLALCVALYYIVKILHKLVMSSGGEGKILRWIKKSLSVSAYLTMLLGMGLTIAVQSSSIITSTFTPLVGLNILTVEQMFPLTLGANIGTTFTAILAALVTDSRNAIQIALCHFLFNIIGILIWYPIPYTRKVPLNMAYRLGDLVSKFKWFGIFYILYAFVLFPSVTWGISYMLELGNAGLVFGIIFIITIMVLSVLLFRKFEYFGNKIEIYLKNNNKCTSCVQPDNIIDSDTSDSSDEDGETVLNIDDKDEEVIIDDDNENAMEMEVNNNTNKLNCNNLKVSYV